MWEAESGRVGASTNKAVQRKRRARAAVGDSDKLRGRDSQRESEAGEMDKESFRYPEEEEAHAQRRGGRLNLSIDAAHKSIRPVCTTQLALLWKCSTRN